MRPLGQHTLIELSGCVPANLKDTLKIRELLLRAVVAGKGTVVTESFHTFEPHGVSGVVIIAESHVTIHTWPENHFAAVDIFTCGEGLQPDTIASVIENGLGASKIQKTTFARGPAVPSTTLPSKGPNTT